MNDNIIQLPKLLDNIRKRWYKCFGYRPFFSVGEPHYLMEIMVHVTMEEEHKVISVLIELESLHEKTCLKSAEGEFWGSMLEAFDAGPCSTRNTNSKKLLLCQPQLG